MKRRLFVLPPRFYLWYHSNIQGASLDGGLTLARSGPDERCSSTHGQMPGSILAPPAPLSGQAEATTESHTLREAALLRGLAS